MAIVEKRSSPEGRVKAWLKLALSIFLLILFTYGLGPLGLKLPGMANFSHFAQTRDIDVTAIYYTDIEEFAQAEADLRHTLTYTPKISSE